MSQANYVYGIHAVNAVLKNHPEKVKEILLQVTREKKRTETSLSLAKKHRIPVHQLSRDELDKLVGETTHQGVVASVEQAESYSENDLDELLTNLKEPPFLLILDEVQDPHNLGACLRSADAAGVHAVIAPKDQSVGLTPTAKKIASGAAESVPFIQVTNLVRTIKKLQELGVWFIGAAEEADEMLFDASLTGPIGIIMGAEGKGMRRLTKEACDYLIQIPMKGIVSSLNVSVATGICLFEVVRQRSNSLQ